MEKLGATGKFPKGKLREEDEGEIQFAVATDKENKVVLLDFGKPVVWLGLPAAEARMLANILNEKADELTGKTKQKSGISNIEG